jgi:uncharacterized membrane protein
MDTKAGPSPLTKTIVSTVLVFIVLTCIYFTGSILIESFKNRPLFYMIQSNLIWALRISVVGSLFCLFYFRKRMNKKN